MPHVPATAVCVVLCALVLGPLLSDLPVSAYFSHPETWSYIAGNLKFSIEELRFGLPGVFDGAGVNGSLWTLPAEFAMYGWVSVAGILGFLGDRKRLLFALALWFAAALVNHRWVLLTLPQYVPMAACFWFGCLAWQFRARLRLRLWIVVVLGAGCILLREHWMFQVLFLCAIVYASLWVSYVPKLPQMPARMGDYSFGIYLWGAPVQQSLVQLIPGLSPIALTVLAIPVAGFLAVCSWHLLEAPVLRWNRRREACACTAAAVPAPTPYGAGSN